MESFPLEGVRIADFTQALSGPYCTLLLADLGAHVIKVERAGTGDDSRAWGPPFIGDTAAYFLSINRNKRSIELDLKSDDGRVLAAADRAGVPAGPIRDLAEVFTDPATEERGMILDAEHPRLGMLRSPGAAWHLDGDTSTVRRPPPDLGEHTSEILAELRLPASTGNPVAIHA